jgi:hypothetical protein
VSASTDTEPTLRTSIIEQPMVPSAVAKASSIWPVLVIATGLLASLAWTGLLAWIVARIIIHVW